MVKWILTLSLLIVSNISYCQFGVQDTLSTSILNPKVMGSGDFDNDGFTDIIISEGGSGSTSLLWLKNLGGGNFASPIDLGVVITNFSSISRIKCEDFDYDGDIDIMASTDRFIENTGGGVFLPPVDLTSTSFGPWSDLYMDYDNDGYKDFVFGYNSPGAKVYFARNNGNNTYTDSLIFTLQQQTQTPFVSAPMNAYLSLVDVNEDGLLDVIPGYATQLSWLENLGNDTLSTPHLISPLGMAITHSTPVDLDMDGDMDFVTCSNAVGGGPMYLFENSGGGNFSYMSLPVTSAYDDKPDFFDIDLDGDLDIIVAEVNGFNNIAWLENLGGLNFSSPQIITSLSYYDHNLIFEDIDNDGDLDLFSNHTSYNLTYFFENYTVNSTQISGRLFIDENQNNVLDSGDLPMQQVGIFSNPLSDFSFTFASGDYFLNLSDTAGTYLVFPDSIPNWSIVTDSLYYSIDVDSNFVSIDSLDFGFYPDTLVTDINAQLIGGYPRCNQVVNYWATVENIGTTLPSGVVQLHLDDSLSIVNAIPMPDSIIGQDIFWHVDSLSYFSEEGFNINVLMPDFQSIGASLVSTITFIEIDSTGTQVSNFGNTLSQTLVCAYDPNDKLSFPAGVGGLGYILDNTERIEYTIRFQNTGNDTALVVVIEDQLDSNLDWYSLDVLSSSHYVQTEVESDGLLTFTFDNINLPDSNVNFLGSQGFVKFSLDIDSNALAGTSIYNTGSIYFDQNPPVITNTKINTLYNCNSILDSIENLNSVICFETSLEAESDLLQTTYVASIAGSLYDTVPSFYWSPDSSGLFNVNILGYNDLCVVDTSFVIEVLDSIPPSLIDSVDICFGDSIDIFGISFSQGGIYYDTLVSMSGCDSLIGIKLNVYPELLSADSAWICNGDSLLVFGTYESTAGIYEQVLQNSNGCDSTSTMMLNVLPSIPVTNTGTTIICEGDSTYFGTYLSSPGIHEQVLQGANGCDSVLTMNLQLSSPPNVFFTSSFDTLCNSDSPVTLTTLFINTVYFGNGVTGNTFNPTVAGLGSHLITCESTNSNGCTGIDSTIIHVVDCDTLALEYLSVFSDLEVYPNPFTSQIVVDFGSNADAQNYNIYILDVVGKIVYRYLGVNENRTTLNDLHIGSGIYCLVLEDSSSGLLFSTKLVKGD